MIEKVVITDAFLRQEEQLFINPQLKPFEKKLLAMKQYWAESDNFTPLSWFSARLDTAPASLLANLCETLPEHSKQFWVVSPYHARLTRSTLRVMPDAMFSWSQQDAETVARALNPLLADEGLALHVVGDSLLMSCDRVWNVFPVDFADVSGLSLPDRLPSGRDAGVWMRLLSEIQMSLHQLQLQNSDGLDIHGLWFWGQSDRVADLGVQEIPHIATRNIYLASVLRQMDKQQDASIVVSEAEHLPLLLNAALPLPKHWILLGAGKSVELKRSVVTKVLTKAYSATWKGFKL